MWGKGSIRLGKGKSGAIWEITPLFCFYELGCAGQTGPDCNSAGDPGIVLETAVPTHILPHCQVIKRDRRGRTIGVLQQKAGCTTRL